MNALRQERGITFEQAYDEIVKPDWVRQYKGTKTDLENQVINKAKSIARGRRGVTQEAHHVVRDFSTLPDLIKHAKSDLGATHVSGQGAETRIYFPLGSGQYEEATVWQKGNYWHATGPGARQRVSKPPRDAKPITQQGMRWASEASRGPSSGPFSAWQTSLLGTMAKATSSQEAKNIFGRYEEEIRQRYRNGENPHDVARTMLDRWEDETLREPVAREASRAPRYSAHQSEDNALIDFVFRGEEKIGYIAGPFSNSKGTVYKWKLYSIPNQKSLPFGMSGMSGEARSRQAALNALTGADKALTTRRTEHFPETVSEAPRRSSHKAPPRRK